MKASEPLGATGRDRERRDPGSASALGVRAWALAVLTVAILVLGLYFLHG